MTLDIRVPIGSMFGLLGLVLLIYGIATNGHEMYSRSLGINVNLWWGLVLVAFGGLMLLFAFRRKAKAAGSAPERPDPRG